MQTARSRAIEVLTETCSCLHALIISSNNLLFYVAKRSQSRTVIYLRFKKEQQQQLYLHPKLN